MLVAKAKKNAKKKLANHAQKANANAKPIVAKMVASPKIANVIVLVAKNNRKIIV
jgi:hypothetical protein